MATFEELTHQRLITVPDELWTEVLPGLWQGGTDDDDTIDVAAKTYYGTPNITKAEFDAVVTLYAWARPVDWEVEELRWGFYDSQELPEWDKLAETVNWAHRRWENGDRVLIRCQAGLNRSGLITALVLMRHGWSADSAIQLLRQTRSPWVLCNRDFERAIHELDELEVIEW
jgi:hypothetical protein